MSGSEPGDLRDPGLGCITDVAGIRVGHWTDRVGATGCSVILAESGAVGGIDVRGGYPGTRDCAMLDASNVSVPVHAVTLSGGSNQGLEACSGVARWLRERGKGARLGRVTVPRVAGAVIFDLGVADPDAFPGLDAGYEACEKAAGGPVEEGTVGAGTGAVVGRLLGRRSAVKSGLGTASVAIGGITVGALMVVNPIGSVHGLGGEVLAGPRDPETGAFLDSIELLLDPEFESPAWLAGQSTVIGVVATDAKLAPDQATRVARMAQAGMATVVRPAHTELDGDAIFCLSTAETESSDLDLTRLGAAAALATATAIRRGVTTATGLDGIEAASRGLS